MKLLKCYVENFGKLHNYSHEFHEGLNEIKKDNGYGKTTFASFIKAMFYGLDAGTGAKTDRKKYMPWQGGNYGGYIEFEINNQKYRIERFFGKKQAEDTFKLYDLNTNLETNTYTSNIGEEIFSLNKSAYERSTYIPQGQIQIDMEDSLNAKLINMLESDNDINTSDEAINAISKAKKVYIKDRGSTGLINEKTEKLHRLEREFEKTKSDTELLQNSRERMKQIIKQIEEQETARTKMETELGHKMEQSTKIAKLETYKSIITKYQNVTNQIEPLNNFFKNGIPEDADLKKLIDNNTEFENVKSEIANSQLSENEIERLQNLQEKFKDRNLKEEEIDTAIKNSYNLPDIEKDLQFLDTQKESEENKIKANKRNGIIIGLIGLIITIGSLVLKFAKIQEIMGIVGLAIGIVILIVAILMLVKEKKSNLYNILKQIAEKEKAKEEIQEQLYNLLQKDISNASEIAIELSNIKTSYKEYNELRNKKAEKDINLQRFMAKKVTLENEIKSTLSKYFVTLNKPYLELIQELNIKRNELKMNQEQLENLTKEKEIFEKENDIGELKVEDISQTSETELKQNISDIKNNVNHLLDAKNQLKNNIEFLENKIDDNDDLENDISNLKEEITELQQKYTILNKTEELLKMAKEQFSANYLKEMVDGFKKYLNKINNKELITAVDTNLDVKIEVNGSQKDIASFSAGYKDLIYICMRFGLINTLYKNEKPFVILDDPFVNLDDEKTSRALKVIAEIADEYQLIYFVCNSSRI